MRKFVVLVALINLVLLLHSDKTIAQTERQKKALKKYLEEEGNEIESLHNIRDKTPDIYQDKIPQVPPNYTNSKSKSGDPDKADDEDQKGKRNLKRFGLEMFSHPPDRFISSTEVPVSPDYILGPGDHLYINLWGHVNERFGLVIDREGKVFIPKAGELVLWGLSLNEAETRIRNLLDEIYSDFRLNVVLGKIRSITVYVGGEVVRPGAYTVSSLYTMFNTLYLAGGPTVRGSLRDIRLLREGKIEKHFDFYEFLVNGESADVRLESNDIIFVPVVGDLVTVRGEVKRPAVYEVMDEEKLMDVLELAGGVRSSGYLGNVEVVRYKKNFEKILLTLDLSDEHGRKENNLELEDHDVVTVRKIHEFTEDVVYLRGQVKYGGEYEYFEGMRISDLVTEDMLLPDSYLERAFLTRIMPNNKKKMFTIDLRKVVKNPGRYFKEVVRSDDNALAYSEFGEGGSRVLGDIILQPQDRLEIFHVDRMTDPLRVRVEGEVRHPGDYRYAEDMRVSDLLISAGGVKMAAYLLSGELARLAHHSNNYSMVKKFNVREALCNSHTEDDPKLKAGDLVYVRRKPGYHDHETVLIEGEVVFPGSYVIEDRNETLIGLLKRAGGLTEMAFPEGAIFYRTSLTRELKGRHVDDVVKSLQRTYVDSLGGLKIRRTPVEGNVDKMRRIIIDLPSLLEDYRRDNDIVMRGGDRILVPRRPSGVSVMGAVASSGTIKFRPGREASYYIDQAGGLRKNSDQGEIRIIRASGRVIKEDAMSEEVALGDVIIVPEKVLKDHNWLEIFQASVSIISGAITTVFLITKL